MSNEEQFCFGNNSLSGFNITSELSKDQLKPCIALTVVAVFGIVGNVVAFCTVTTRKFEHLSFSVYILCLNIADITNLLVTTLPYVLEWIFETHPSTVTGIPGFLTVHFFSQTSQMVSSWLVIAISMDRFIVVVYPLQRCRLCTKRKAILTSAGIVLTSAIIIVVEVVTVLLLNRETFCNFWEVGEFTSMSNLRGLVLTLFLPAVVCLVLNVKVFKAVKEMFSVRQQLTECSGKQTESNSNHLKVTLALTVLTALSSVLFIPVILIDIIDAIQLENHQASGGKASIVRRQCVGELIYIIDISLHFYILILILYGSKKSCFTGIPRSFNRLKTVVWSPQSPEEAHGLGKPDAEKQTDIITMHI